MRGSKDKVRSMNEEVTRKNERREHNKNTGRKIGGGKKK